MRRSRLGASNAMRTPRDSRAGEWRSAPRVRSTGPFTAAMQGALLGALTLFGAYVLYQGGSLGPPFVLGLMASLVVGAALGALRRGWASGLLWTGAAAVVLLLTIVTATPVMLPLARSVVRRDPLPNAADVDAVVALSANITAEGLVAGRGIDRLIDASRLAGLLQRPLVVTVLHPLSHSEPSSLADQRALAAQLGAPQVLDVDQVFSTRDEAVRVAALARQQGWRRVAVVTSPLHTRRACATFERVGLAVRCVASRPRDMTIDGAGAMQGSTERMRAFASWLHEAIGYLVYRSRGWV